MTQLNSLEIYHIYQDPVEIQILSQNPASCAHLTTDLINLEPYATKLIDVRQCYKTRFFI